MSEQQRNEGQHSSGQPRSRYHVVYSKRVTSHLETLVRLTSSPGKAKAILEAAKEIDRRLGIYPQFGEPLRSVRRHSSQIWLGVVDPLVVHYSIHEDIRQVWVVVPKLLLPGICDDL
jgi:hypothetical protein